MKADYLTDSYMKLIEKIKENLEYHKQLLDT